MENIIITVVLLAIACKSTKNDLTYLMATGCAAAWLIGIGPLIMEIISRLLIGELNISKAYEFMINSEKFYFDIALYYALNATLFALLALYAVNLKTTSSVIYAIIMLCQVFLCLLLISDWGNAGNTTIQNLTIYLNDGILTLLLLLGVTGSGNFISNGFNNSRLSGGFNNNRSHRD